MSRRFCPSCGVGLYEGQYVCWNCEERKFRKDFLKKDKKIENSEICFVATVAFEDPDCDELVALREFRDNRLLTNPFGRLFVGWYYRNGAVLARWITKNSRVKSSVKYLLVKFVNNLRKS